MNEYLFSVVFVAFLISAVSFVSYRENEPAQRFALGVLICFSTLLPLVKILPSVNFDKIISEIHKLGDSGDGAYADNAKSALEKGICDAVCEKFSLDTGEVAVLAEGFDFEKMSAEKIRITLFGGAIFANVEKIEKYVLGLGAWGCEVSIGL